MLPEATNNHKVRGRFMVNEYNIMTLEGMVIQDTF